MHTSVSTLNNTVGKSRKDKALSESVELNKSWALCMGGICRVTGICKHSFWVPVSPPLSSAFCVFWVRFGDSMHVGMHFWKIWCIGIFFPFWKKETFFGGQEGCRVGRSGWVRFWDAVLKSSCSCTVVAGGCMKMFATYSGSSEWKVRAFINFMQEMSAVARKCCVLISLAMAGAAPLDMDPYVRYFSQP